MAAQFLASVTSSAMGTLGTVPTLELGTLSLRLASATRKIPSLLNNYFCCFTRNSYQETIQYFKILRVPTGSTSSTSIPTTRTLNTTSSPLTPTNTSEAAGHLSQQRTSAMP
eukprot:3033219-Rhodomonas_salina.1